MDSEFFSVFRVLDLFCNPRRLKSVGFWRFQFCSVPEAELDREREDFTVHFSFIITTQNDSFYGNGLAFILAPAGYPMRPNSAGGVFGLLNSTARNGTSPDHIIMVEFDILNTDWDPPFERVGINNNSLSAVKKAPWNAGSNSGKLANVWTIYNASCKSLSVFWTYDDNPVFMGNSSLSCQIDLKKNLPEWITIGFSVGTGECTEYNRTKSWDFTSNLDTEGMEIMVMQIKHTVALLSTLIWREDVYQEDFHAKNYLCQEPLRATNGFADDGRLGQGGSARVYKATLDDQRLVAVKRIFAESEGFFINELKIISRLIHGNLVRYKIAVGLASVLHYLHEGVEQCVLHRDIKSAYVLLDTDFTTKLGDFGFAKLVDQRLKN
ncbi:L-type lectin-domain containing receptor kinase IX.1-like [Herrania umbratica]|uniref:L-type lectin-domain containing receptor kinase IX.1-like n=1 Tax=Herrania umbratica TaxID=108875 RepID=A0A6J1ASC7_9ROSI|nr:L-type lectin-domain containing receptor kinase IX.1-like [Herrania umbratica]